MADLIFIQEIAAPAKIVGAFFVPHRMGAWYGRELDLQFEAQGGAIEFRNGLKVRLTGRFGKREVSHTAVVTEFERGRVLEWQFQDAYGVRGLQRWEIEGDANGTRLRMRDCYEMPGRFGRFFDWLITRHAVARRDRRELQRLKRMVEHEP
ncbi:MAG TPA: SRPBCC family protein [Candidatus Dormibacteraeota bacterium]|nr:SRPBCC family protein [Candidatus Dormibacteraeota bacterium]